MSSKQLFIEHGNYRREIASILSHRYLAASVTHVEEMLTDGVFFLWVHGWAHGVWELFDPLLCCTVAPFLKIS